MSNKRKHERNVGENMRKEARKDFQYNYGDRKVLIGEVIDLEKMDKEDSIHLRYMRGMSQHDEQLVYEQILSTLKMDYGAEVHKEFSENMISAYGVSSVMSTAQITGIIGEFPLRDNFPTTEEYENRIRVYTTNQISLSQEWIKERREYKDKVEKAIGHILKNHVSAELWKSIKFDQPVLYKECESSTNMVVFKQRLKKAIDIANGNHEVELKDIVMKEITTTKIKHFGCASTYLTTINELILKYNQILIKSRIDRLSANLSVEEKTKRVDEITAEITDETDSNNTINNKIYKEVLTHGMPEVKRKEYLSRDSELEMPDEDLNQYSRMHVDGVTTGGVKALLAALSKTVNNLKKLNPTQKIYYGPAKFSKNLNVSITNVDDGKAAKDDKEKRKKECWFCRDKLYLREQVYSNHKRANCLWNPDNNKKTKEEIEERIKTAKEKQEEYKKKVAGRQRHK